MSAQHLQEKWAPILGHDDLPEIKDSYRKAVTAQLLENQERFLREQSAMGVSNGLLTEAPTMNTGFDGTGTYGQFGDGTPGFSGGADAAGPVAGFDPVLISLIRRSMPNLIAYDIAGVQPMSGPTGLIFAMRALYDGPDGTEEAFFNEPDPEFSANLGNLPAGKTVEFDPNGESANPGLLASTNSGNFLDGTVGGADDFVNIDGSTPAVGATQPGGDAYDPILSAMTPKINTGDLEAAGETGKEFRQMGFSIEKVMVEARGRALKAQYSMELAQDLRAIHGLDAEAELANILSSEILAEINREVVRTVYRTARPGAQNNVNAAGTFDLDLDSNGRWSVEKFKGLLFQIERDCNAIAQLTRRGKGNMIICSADVASALTMAGVLDYTPALNANLNVDDTGNLFAGTINGKLKVFIDPFSANVSDTQYYVAGYKGTSAYDAGLFYCPYVPLQMVRSVTAETFQPNIGFKTRYGIVANPFAEGAKGAAGNQGLGRLVDNTNRYYRRVTIANLM